MPWLSNVKASHDLVVMVTVLNLCWRPPDLSKQHHNTLNPAQASAVN